MTMLQRTEYDADPAVPPCGDVVVVQAVGDRHALVYIPPIKGSAPTVEVYAEASDAEDRAARLCEAEGLPPFQLSTDQSGAWMAGLVARPVTP